MPAAMKRPIASAIVAAAFVIALPAATPAARQPARAAAEIHLPSVLPRDRHQLAADIDGAQAIIEDASSTPAELQSAGAFEQLATAQLAGQPPRARGSTLALLAKPAAVSIRANLTAAAALAGLAERHNRLPQWKIVQPPSPKTLLSHFRAAQHRFGIPWQYLAAIEFIETKFGRVHGQSSAGAQGPMQFLPSTWALYGTGNIDNPRDAILSAARYLVANGAPADMTDALYHYNNSLGYVHAVQDYAARMIADPRAYYGYYSWRVLYTRVGGTVILPVGYPRVHAVPVRLLGVHER
jgi:membrane-bound lytic murein transglycosylase B